MSAIDTVVESLEDKVAEKIWGAFEKCIDPRVTMAKALEDEIAGKIREAFQSNTHPRLAAAAVLQSLRAALKTQLDPNATARLVLRIVDAHKTDTMTRKDAARYLTSKGFPIAAKTLSNMASEKKGPKFTQTGWCTVVYRAGDLDEWLRIRLRGPVNTGRRARAHGEARSVPHNPG